MPEPSRAGSAPLLDNPWFKVRLCCQTGLTRLLGFQTDRRQLGSSMPELSELSNGHIATAVSAQSGMKMNTYAVSVQRLSTQHSSCNADPGHLNAQG